MNAITLFHGGPPVPDARLAVMVARFVSAGEGSDFGRLTIRADHAPTADERRVLESRGVVLDHALTPADPDDVTLKIAAFRLPFSGWEDADEAALNADIWTETLRPFPIWAIRNSIGRFLRAAVPGDWNRKRGPTPPEFCADVREQLAPMLAERRRIERVLAAEIEPVITAAERAAVLARVGLRFSPDGRVGGFSLKAVDDPTEGPESACLGRRLAAARLIPITN